MPQELEEICSKLEKGVAPEPVSVRDLLAWFGASRRGSNVVRSIRRALERHGLETHPDFERAWIDAYVRFVLEGSEDETSEDVMGYRIDALEAANRTPTWTSPDAPLAEAVTLMLANDYSQLPVMTTEREVKGTISWKSIGSRLSLGKGCATVRDCMDQAVVVSSGMSLFEAIDKIATEDYVLVKSRDGLVAGIVTATDLAEQFRELAEPFLIIGEIENLLRRLLHGKFSAKQLKEARDEKDAGRAIEGVADLTLGELVRLLQNQQRWKKLQLNIARQDFVQRLDRVRIIRNETMHFDPQGIDPDALQELRAFARFLRELHRLGAMG